MKTITLKHKVLRVSWKNFLPTLAKFGATKNIRLFFDYGYKTLYANSVFTVDGVKYRIETRGAKIKFCNEFAEKCRKHGYTVDLPIDNRKVNEMFNNTIKTVIK